MAPEATPASVAEASTPITERQGRIVAAAKMRRPAPEPTSTKEGWNALVVSWIAHSSSESSVGQPPSLRTCAR